MRNIFLHIAVLLVALAMSVDAQDVPRVISYQGVLVGADGKPESGNVDVTFELMPLNGAPSITWSEQRKGLAIRGGLFHVFLGDSSMPKGFPILSGEYALSIKVGTNAPNFVRFGSVPYALNIPNDVVTSAKIKDGEVRAVDLHDMGATDNQVLTRKNGQWRGDDVPKELPEQASEGAVLVYKNGRWQAETPVVPSGVPIGSIIAYWGNTPPDGWLLCDGSQIPDDYESLKEFLSSSQTPNLRGMFLRGANTTINQPSRSDGDPDEAKRVGGMGVSRIGSVQQDAIQQHRHFGFDAQRTNCGDPYIEAFSNDETKFVSSYNNFFTCAQVYCNILATKTATGTPQEPKVGPTSFPTQSSRSSSETRPKNVYVNYIIKAR